MSLRARLVVVSVAAACLFGAPAVHAQAITGTIQGTVTDEDGSSLPGVTISVINTATGYESIVSTNDRGFFQAQLLPLGPYAVTFELEGFATLIREGLELALGQRIDLRIELQLSTVGEEITVTDAAPLIEASRTEGQIRINDRSLEGLPNDGRDFLAFSKLTPGVTIVQGPDGEELSINGQKGINNNVMVDGADFNNPFFGEQRGGQRPAFTFNIDAVKEMVVITDGAPAEFGRSSGGFVNVITKSGTNNFRGSAHAFFKNDSLSSNPQLRGGGREPDSSFDQTQLGFTLGGPLKKDEFFFFVAADQQRADQTKQTDPGRIPADVVDFLASVGLPNENAPINRTDDGDAYLAKLDYQVNDSNLFTARWAYHYSQQVNGTFDVDSWGPSANAVETDYAHGYTMSLISNVSNNVLNEFRGQYAKEWRPRPYDGPQIPNQNRPFPDTAFVSSGGIVRVGMPFFIPVIYDDDRIQLNDNVSLLRGNHSYKAGFEYNDIESSQTFIGFANGRFIFGSFEGFRNYVNLGPGYVECGDGRSGVGIACGASGHVGPVLLFLQQAGVGGLTVEEAGTQNLGQKENAIFVQDQWRPMPSMTIELGLRWELMDQPEVITPPSDVFFADFIGQSADSLIGPVRFPSNGKIPDDDVLQPRFAISFTPKGKTNQVFRFNAGLFAARIPALTLASVRSTNGSRGQSIFRASFFNDFGGPPPPGWTDLLGPDQVGTPFQPEVYVFDEDFVLPRTWSTSLSWENEYKPNWALLVKANYAKTDHITRWINRNDALIGSPWGTGLPGGNGLGTLWTVESSARSRYYGLTLGLNKRWSDNYQFQAYYTFSEDKSDDDNERDPFSLRYANATNLAPEYGLSDRHQENRFNFWMSWLAPYDINVNLRFTYLDAQPLDIKPDGTPVDQPSDRCIGGCTIGGPVFQRNQGKKDNEFQTLDLRVSKDFQVGSWTVQPVIDVFNVTDEPNFLVPEATGLLFNFDGTVRSGGGDPREIQLGVRLLR